MTDYYLKFADESEATLVLEGYEGSVDVIGEIPDIMGWHVNLRGEENPAFDAFVVEITVPYRTWA